MDVDQNTSEDESIEADQEQDDDRLRNMVISLLKYVLCEVPGYEDDSTDENEMNGQELVDWVERFWTSIKQDLHSCLPSEAGPYTQVPVIMGLYTVLRECLLSQRWDDALRLIVPLCLRGEADESILKVGFEIFHKQDSGSERLLGQLSKQLYHLSKLNEREVVQEYFFYLMQKNNIEEAGNIFKERKRIQGKRLKLFKSFPHDQQLIEIEFKAYEGLLFYVQWLQTKRELELDKLQSSEIYMGEGKQLILSQSMESYAKKAIACLQIVRGEPGVWDIFITKYVQLLEFLQNIEEAENVLLEYSQKNADNVNAHKYLYQFLGKHKRHSDQQILLLQKISLMVPSDSYVLELYRREKDNGGSSSETLPILFNLLDFASSKSDSTAWSLLSLHLSFISKSGSAEDQAALNNCWTIREPWWPKYHFTSHQVGLDTLDKTSNGAELLCQKAICALHLISADCEYVVHAKNTISHPHWKSELLEAISKRR